MSAPILSQRRVSDAPPRPGLGFLDGLDLPLGRAHEFCGNARRFLAALVAARTQGPVFWIAPSWQAERLNPEALAGIVNPGRITFVDPLRAEDLLWCAEEVLRSGAVPLMVADLPAPPGLTPVRRLHLAAEASGVRPIGLLLTPGDGGAPGVETRWRLSAAHGAGSRGWRLDRLRARTAPLKSWRIAAQGRAFRAEALDTQA